MHPRNPVYVNYKEIMKKYVGGWRAAQRQTTHSLNFCITVFSQQPSDTFKPSNFRSNQGHKQVDEHFFSKTIAAELQLA